VEEEQKRCGELLKKKDEKGNSKIVTKQTMKRSATTKLLTAKMEEDQFISENRYTDLHLHQHNKAVSINLENNQTAHF
jgi:hypothetical protein